MSVAKIIGILLLIAGVIVLIFGVYGIYDNYDLRGYDFFGDIMKIIIGVVCLGTGAYFLVKDKKKS